MAKYKILSKIDEDEEEEKKYNNNINYLTDKDTLRSNLDKFIDNDIDTDEPEYNVNLNYLTDKETIRSNLDNFIYKQNDEIDMSNSSNNSVSNINTKKEKKSKFDFLNKGAFSDGYQFGDITKTALASSMDFIGDAISGITSVPENIIDIGANLVATAQNKLGFKEAAKKTRDWANKNDNEEAANKIVNKSPIGFLYNLVNGTLPEYLENETTTGKSVKKIMGLMGADKVQLSKNNLDNSAFEKDSVLGETSDKIANLVGYTGMLAVGGHALSSIGKAVTIGSSTLGVSADFGNVAINMGGHVLNLPTLAIAGGMAGGLQEANLKGDDVIEKERWAKAISGGTIEGITEGIFGMLGIGGNDITDTLMKKVTNKITSGAGKMLTQIGIQSTGEAIEEFLSYASNYVVDNVLIDKLGSTDFSTKWNWEDVGEQMALAFVSSGLTAGGTSLINNSSAIKSAEEQLGRKLDNNEKAEIIQTLINVANDERETIQFNPEEKGKNVSDVFVASYNPDGEITNIAQTKAKIIDNPNKKVNVSPGIIKNSDTNSYNIIDTNTGVLLDTTPYETLISAQTEFASKMINLDDASIKGINNKINTYNISIVNQINNALPKDVNNINTTQINENRQESDFGRATNNFAVQDVKKLTDEFDGKEILNKDEVAEIWSNIQDKDLDVSYDSNGDISSYIGIEESGDNIVVNRYDSEDNIVDSVTILNQDGKFNTQEIKDTIKQVVTVYDENKPIIGQTDIEGNEVRSIKKKNNNNDKIQSINDIKTKYKNNTDILNISENKETISLDNMVIKKSQRNKGIGSNIINDLIQYANKKGKTITLTPTNEFGTKTRLTNFYKSKGFVENKGKNTDFMISDTMYKTPVNMKQKSNITQEELQKSIEKFKKAKKSINREDIINIANNLNIYHRGNTFEDKNMTKILGHYKQPQITEIDEFFKDYKDKEDLRKQAYNYALNNYKNEHVLIKDINKTIDIPQSGLKKTFGKNQDNIKMQSANNLLEIIKNAQYLNSSISTKNSSLVYHYFISPIKINESNHLSLITIRENTTNKNDNDKFYYHDIRNINNIEEGKAHAMPHENVSNMLFERFPPHINNSIAQKNTNVKNNTVINKSMQNTKNNTNKQLINKNNKINIKYRKFNTDFHNKGYVDLNNKTINNIVDVADIAQIFRNPNYETFRILYLNGNKIVGQESITSYLPNLVRTQKTPYTSINFYKMKNRMDRLNADGYYLIHNHPSGKAKASDADVQTTYKYIKNMQGFKGHIIVNSGTYATLTLNSNNMLVSESEIKIDNYTPDEIDKMIKNNPLNDIKIDSRENLIKFAYDIKNNPNYSTLLFTDSINKIRIILDTPNSIFNNKELDNYIKNIGKKNGATHAFVATTSSEVFNKTKQLSTIKDSILYAINNSNLYIDGFEEENVNNIFNDKDFMLKRKRDSLKQKNTTIKQDIRNNMTKTNGNSTSNANTENVKNNGVRAMKINKSINSPIMNNYDETTANRIEMNDRNVIVKNNKHLSNLINEALNSNENKALHLGKLNEGTINNIKNKIQNLPKSKQNYLTKNNYDLVINQSEIRHLLDNKAGLTEREINHFIQILPNIISNSDYISYTNNLKDEGLRFKKLLEDGTYVSFVVVSNKQGTMKVKTIYMEKGDYENKKRSISLTTDVDTTPDNTSKTNRVSASNTSIPQNTENVKNNGIRAMKINKSTSSNNLQEVDNQGRILTKQQQEFFKNSIARDKKGNLKTLYHGTDTEFTVFSYDFLGKNGTANGKGFYLADNINVAKSYSDGKNLIEAYVNIEKPLSIGNTTISQNEYIKFLEAVNEKTNGTLFADYGDGEKVNKGTKEYIDIINQFKEEYTYGGDDVDLVLSILNSANIKLEDGYRLLKETIGYDGIIVETSYKDNGKDIQYTQYIPLIPEQIKNINNTNPTSSKDIRFARRSAKQYNAQRNAEREGSYIEQEIQKIEQSGNWDDTIPVTKMTDIRKTIEDYLGLGIKKGHFREQAYGIYKDKRDVIRTKELKDMDTILHETGHALDLGNRIKIDKESISDELLKAVKKYGGYETDSRTIQLDEGFAEIIREYSIIPEQAKIDYPQTVAIIEEIRYSDNSFNNFITKVQQQTYNYIHQNPKNRTLSNMSVGEQTDKIPLTKDWVKQEAMRNIWDKDYSLKSAVNTIQEINEKTINELKASNNSYYLTRLASGIGNKITSILSNGYIDENGNKLIPGLSQIGEILGDDPERYNDLRAFLVAQRDLEYKARTLKTGLRTTDSKSVINEFKNDTEIHEAAKIIYNTLDGVLKYAVNNHLISEEDAVKLKKSNAFYVPMQRVIKNRGNQIGKRGSVNDIIKKRTGSELDIKDILENIVTNSANIIQQVENNNILKALYEQGESSKMTGVIYDVIDPPMTKIGTASLNIWENELKQQGVDTNNLNLEKTIDLFAPNNKVNTEQLITSFINNNGKRIYLQFNDELIFNSIMNMDKTFMSNVLKINSKLNMPLRYGATMANLGFAIPNMISDTAQASIYSTAGFIPIVDNALGVLDILTATNSTVNNFMQQIAPDYANKINTMYQLYEQSGATSSTRLSQYRKSTQEIMKNIYGTRNSETLGIHERFKPLKRLLDFMTFIPEISEQSTRFRVFERNYDYYKNKGMAETDTRIMAALESRDATQDFGRTGNITREINQLIPFSAARVGSIYTFAEKVKANPKQIGMRIAILTALAMAIKALGYDDDEIEELNQRKKDDNFVLKVGDNIVTIKKPQGILRSMINLAEYIQDLAIGNIEEGKESDRLINWLNNAIMDNMPTDEITGLVPNMVAPLIENAINKDLYYNTDIVKSYDLDLPDSEQYYDYNSQLAILLGKVFNYSPAKIDNLISGYFGGLGTQVIGIIDTISSSLGLSAEKPKMGAESDTIGKRFIVNVNSNSSSLDEIYNQKTDLTKKENGGTITKEEQEKLDKIKDAISNISKVNKQMKSIKADLTLSGEDKAKQIKELQKQRTDLARQALGKNILYPENEQNLKLIEFYPTQNSLSKNNYTLNLTDNMKKEYAQYVNSYYSRYQGQGIYSEDKLKEINKKAKDYAKEQLFDKYSSKLIKTSSK